MVMRKQMHKDAFIKDREILFTFIVNLFAEGLRLVIGLFGLKVLLLKIFIWIGIFNIDRSIIIFVGLFSHFGRASFLDRRWFISFFSHCHGRDSILMLFGLIFWFLVVSFWSKVVGGCA